MAQIDIETARFGEVAVDEDRIIRFVEPVLGFPASRRYILLDHADDSPFKWLQSADEPELAFVVTNPKLFGIEYEFVVSEEVAGQLSLESAEDALVLAIVNIPQSAPGKMTANLLGPVVVNQTRRQAMQIVLNDNQYSAKTRLISDEALERAVFSSASVTASSVDKGE